MPFNVKAIKELMKDANLSLEELATELGKSKGNLQTSIKLWEKVSNPTLETIDQLYLIAKKYGSDAEFYIKPKV